MSLTSNIISNHNQDFSAVQDLVMNVLLNFLLKKLIIMPFFFFFSSFFWVKGYKSSNDSGNCTHGEGATEDPQENPH